jgi:hypothetical protein
MAEITKEEMRERMGNIDQIRDIIFGAQLREYNSRIEKIESNLSLLEQEMRDRAEQVKNTCIKEMRAAIESLESKHQTLSLNSQNENAEMRQAMERLNKKFSGSIEMLDKTVERQTGSLQKDLSESREKLHEDIHHLRSQIFEELDRRFSTMKAAKVSRDDMAEILFELGLRLKGTEFEPELKEAAGGDTANDMPLLEAGQSSE